MRSFGVGLLFGILISIPIRCTVISHAPPVVGWPDLAVVEHKTDHKTMRDRCQKYAPFGGLSDACAEIDLPNGVCTIWYVYDEHLEHERLHCNGHDHLGGETLQRMMDAWNRQR